MKHSQTSVHNWKISIKRVNPLGQNRLKETSWAFKAGQALKNSGFASDSIGRNWKQDLRRPILLGEKYQKQFKKLARSI